MFWAAALLAAYNLHGLSEQYLIIDHQNGVGSLDNKITHRNVIEREDKILVLNRFDLWFRKSTAKFIPI
jgi:hypothetical protein